MSRTKAAIEAELLALTLYDNEPDAIDAWAEAYTAYFEDAQSAVTSVPVISAALHAAGGPKELMAAAMVGLSTAGAAAIVAGITAFWGRLVTGPASSYFSGATVIAPPAAIAGLSAALVATFATNIATSASKADAMGAIADDLHTASNGGTVTFPGPSVEAIA